MINYGLPLYYSARLNPKYFDDVLPDADYWQADVYRLAAALAREHSIPTLVDIGCGRAGKLMQYSHEFGLVGFDYGVNIEACKQEYPDDVWYAYDLAREIINIPIFTNRVVICADVIEHIPNLTALLQTLKNASESAHFVLLSTPDRDRLNQGTPYGPPANPAHVREWTNGEFTAWLKDEGLPVVWSGWTVSYDKQPDKRNTILVILSNKHRIERLPDVFEAVI